MLALDKQICTLTIQHPQAAIYVLGDLQDKLTPTQYRQKKTQHLRSNGILSTLLQHSFRCPLFEAPDTPLPYTTWGRNGGPNDRRPLDYIWANDAGWRLTTAGGVDTGFTRTLLGSDHDLVYQDIDIAMPIDAGDTTLTETLNWKRVSQIKIRQCPEDEEHNLIFDESQFGTRQTKEDKDMIDLLRQHLQTTPEEQHLAALEADLLQLEKDICHAACTRPWDYSKGELPPRNKQHADRTADIMTRFQDHLRRQARDLGLATISSNVADIAKRQLQISRTITHGQSLDVLLQPTRCSISQTTALVTQLVAHAAHILRTPGHDGDTPWTAQEICNFAKACAALEETIINTYAAAKDDIQEWEDNIEAIEQHRATDAPQREQERALLIAAVTTEDTARLQQIFHDAGCPGTFQTAPTSFLGVATCDPGQLTFWTGDDCSCLTTDTDLQATNVYTWVTEAQKRLQACEQRLKYLARSYWAKRVAYAARRGETSTIARALLCKPKEQPEGHPLVQDLDTGVWRRCRNTDDIKQGTYQVHARWMGPSGADRECHYVTMKHDDVGPCGVDINPTRPFTATDLDELIPDHSKCSLEERTRFTQAHAGHIGKLFDPPPSRAEFHWPYYVHQTTGEFVTADLEERFWQALEARPGKMRHDGYHMAYVGRMTTGWAKVYFRLIRIMMITRTRPQSVKHVTRLPIGKAGKPGETRPLALMDDTDCFISGETGRKLTNAIMTAGNAAPELAAYKPGHGCDDVTIQDIAAREDALEFLRLFARIDEDEEKMYDRISGELQCAALRKIGCPEAGYVEMKADDLHDRIIHVLCKEATILAMFRMGLLQGSGFSVAVANPVVELKYLAWRLQRDSLQAGIAAREPGALHAYVLHTTDPADGRDVYVWAGGYCDDNIRFLGQGSLMDLLRWAQDSIDNAGDFSLVTKLGRKGDKSGVTLFNINPLEMTTIPLFTSVAWSFAENRPLKEEVKTRVHFRPVTQAELDTLTPVETIRLLDFVSLHECVTPAKHLGITSDLAGYTHYTAANIIANVHMRLSDMRLWRLKDQELLRAINSLLTTVAAYAPILSGLTNEDTTTLDKTVLRTIRRACGMAPSDNQMLLGINPADLGNGLRLFTEAHLCALARELEVILNDTAPNSCTARARIAAYRAQDSPNDRPVNHFRDAILTLARHGLYVRDQNEGVIPRILDHLLSLGIHRRQPLAAPDSTAHDSTLGNGQIALERYAMGGTIPAAIYTCATNTNIGGATMKAYLLENTGFWRGRNASRSPPGITRHTLALAAKRARADLKHDATALYGFWEWRWTETDTDMNISTNWTWVPAHAATSTDWREADVATSTRDSFIHRTRLDWRRPADRRILQLATRNGWPALIATDGGDLKTLEPTENLVSAAVVLCAPPDTNPGNPAWLEQSSRPLLARMTLLPNLIGFSRSDNNHAELLADNMAEEMLPCQLEALTIIDSQIARDLHITLRDRNTSTQRAHIRNTLSGISKHLALRLADNLRRWNTDAQPRDASTHTRRCTLRIILQLLRGRISTATANPWPEQYWDGHPFRAIVKIDSHQINPDGTSRNRYPAITPCLWLVTANQLADDAASFGVRTLPCPASLAPTVPAPVKFMAGLRFCIVWQGRRLDRDTSADIRTLASREMHRRTCNCPSQGLICRAQPYCRKSCAVVALRGLLRRLVRHWAHAHTRSMYQNSDYRAWNTTDIEATVTARDVAPYEAPVVPTQKIPSRYLQCPLCLHAQPALTQAPHGNITHHHRFCRDPVITTARCRLTDQLEAACRDFCRTITTHLAPYRLQHHFTLLRTQLQQTELNTALTMRAQCRSRTLPPARTTNISIPIADPATTPTPTRWPLCTSLGLNLHDAEGAIPDGCASAIDLAHLGILPDITHAWMNDLIAEASRDPHATPAALRQAWRRIQAWLLLRAECLQRVIRTVLDARHDTLQLRYAPPTTPEPLTPMTPTPPPRRLPDHAMPPAPDPDLLLTTQPTLPRTPPLLKPCPGWRCTLLRDLDAATRTEMINVNAQACPRCKAADTYRRMTMCAEQAILDATQPTLIRALMALNRPDVRPSQRLPRIIQLCADLIHDDEKWAQPRRRGIRNTLPAALQKAGRQMAHTLAIALPPIMNISAADLQPTPERQRSLARQAQLLCMGTCLLDPTTQTPDDPDDPRCPTCLRPRLQCDLPDHCSVCGLPDTPTTALTTTCLVCQANWLVHTNSLAQRHAQLPARPLPALRPLPPQPPARDIRLDPIGRPLTPAVRHFRLCRQLGLRPTATWHDVQRHLSTACPDNNTPPALHPPSLPPEGGAQRMNRKQAKRIAHNQRKRSLPR